MVIYSYVDEVDMGMKTVITIERVCEFCRETKNRWEKTQYRFARKPDDEDRHEKICNHNPVNKKWAKLSVV